MSGPSIQTDSSAVGHSSVVRMWLHAGGAMLPVLQSGATALKLGRSVRVAPGDAVLETTVDGRPHRRAVRVLSPLPETGWLPITDR